MVGEPLVGLGGELCDVAFCLCPGPFTLAGVDHEEILGVRLQVFQVDTMVLRLGLFVVGVGCLCGLVEFIRVSPITDNGATAGVRGPGNHGPGRSSTLHARTVSDFYCLRLWALGCCDGGSGQSRCQCECGEQFHVAIPPYLINVLSTQNAGYTMRRAQIQVFRHLAAGKSSFACNFLAACVTHRSMRNWMRERMKRRKKKPENETEATGKVGQQKPLVDESHPQPIVPTYDDRDAEAAHGSEAVQEPPVADEPRMETEVQPESPSAPPPGAPEHRPVQQAGKSSTRPPKGVVVLAIGLPGSGKTTWFKRRGVSPLSSDMLRSILFDDITEQRYQGLVFSTLRSLLRARLIARMPWNYVDASNLAPHERRQWIKMAKGFGYEVHAVFFDVLLEVCLERNRKWERQVKEDVIQRMAAKLKAPGFEEGFGKITVVRVKRSGEQT